MTATITPPFPSLAAARANPLGWTTLGVGIAALLLGLGGRPASATAALAFLGSLAPALDDEPPRPVRVRVVADGRPVAGARVIARGWAVAPGGGYAAGKGGELVTDADGRLELPLTNELRAVLARGVPLLIHATAPGRGVGWIERAEGADVVTITLPAEGPPIRGRLRDERGRPVVGARVRVQVIGAAGNGPDAVEPPDDSPLMLFEEVDPMTAQFLADPNAGPGLRAAFDRLQVDWGTLTDADGRFTLSGFGSDREVVLTLTHPSMTRVEASVLTRPGPDHVFPPKDGAPGYTVHGPTFELTAATAHRVVTGVVRDADTGRPLAQWTIEAHTRLDSGFDEPVRSQTDAEGRYRCEVAADFGHMTLGLDPPPNGPYLGGYFGSGQPSPGQRAIVVPPQANTPITFDFAAQRVPVVRGRVTDAATGVPISGEVAAWTTSDRPKAEAGRSHLGQFRRVAADGRFFLPVPPGQVVVTFTARPADRYWFGQGADRIPGFDPIKQAIRRDDPVVYIPTNVYTVLAELTADPTQPDPTCDFRVEPGLTVALKALDPDGRLLPAAEVEIKVGGNPTATGPATTLSGFAAGESRQVVARHRGRNIAGVKVIRAADGPEQTIRLDPCGTIRGRILLPDGNPPPHGSFQRGPIYAGDSRIEPAALLTDITGEDRDYIDGRFVITGLVPGLHYGAAFIQTDGSRRTHFPVMVGDFCADLMVRPGEDRAMGDVRLIRSDR